MPKEKLTLSVDKEVVEKAKKIGINISDITEKVLTGYTSAEKPEGSLHDAYQQLFDSILPLLKEFDCSVKIAEGTETVEFTDTNGKKIEQEMPIDFYLESDGSFWMDQYETTLKDIKKISAHYFLSPQKILSNIVDVLARSEEDRKERMKEILMAKRLIDAMSETLVRKKSIQK